MNHQLTRRIIEIQAKVSFALDGDDFMLLLLWFELFALVCFGLIPVNLNPNPNPSLNPNPNL